MNIIHTGGPIIYLLILLFAVIMTLSIRMIIVVFKKNDLDLIPYENSVNSILFWGLICLLLGFLGKFVGLYRAMSVILQATEVSPGILVAGYQQSLISALAGLFISILSFIIWFFLRSRLKKSVSSG